MGAMSLALAGPAIAEATTLSSADLSGLIETCAACHGDNGVPVVEDGPNIWGQNEYYIYVQLKDFKSGLRASDIMQPVVQDMDKATLKALAAYFANKKWPDLQYQTPEADIPIGEQIAVAGQCSQCHLGNWRGNSRVPRLAGQSVVYIQKTMMDFKNGVRKNAPDIAALFTDLTDDQIKSIAHYAAGR